MSKNTLNSIARMAFAALFYVGAGGGLLLSSGCFRASVIVPSNPPADEHSTWVNGWLWGSVGGTVSADNFCGGRPVSRVETKRSVGNVLVSWITLGIYTPTKVSITCSNPYGAPTHPYAPYAPAPAPYGYGYGYNR